MTNLMELIKDDLYENGQIENDIDNRIEMENTINEETLIDENSNSILDETIDESSNNNESNQVNAENENIVLNTTTLNEWINNHRNELVYTMKIDIESINELNNSNLLLLKSINDDHNFILLYKNTDNYKVFNNNCEYMKLFGESGFYILYNINQDYKLKLYGTRTAIYMVMCINYNNKLYPIYVAKEKKSKLSDYHFSNITVNKFEEFLNDNRNFNFEDCILMFKGLSKVGENTLQNKEEVLTWLYNKQESVYDISHAIKFDNAMKQILFM